ncbi:MAG: SDR family oxidoreductase [Betaproteobacteria bacterium]|nr:SDR family oxidoreductase [Betaproteobacteria bacterium]
MRFKGRNVLVTGAAGNLGKAVAAGFAAEGAALVLFDIDDKTLRAAFPSGNHLLVPVNLLEPASVAAAVELALKKVGRIDVLANIAGGFRMGDPVHATPVDTWRLMIELNAGTVMNMARAVVPNMLAHGGGKIVSIAATAGLGGKPDMGAYGASKAAVIRLTESMAGELRDKGINVNCVMPSIIDTPQNRSDMPSADPRKWVALEALAEVIMFLASDAARAVHGAAVPVVGLS